MPMPAVIKISRDPHAQGAPETLRKHSGAIQIKNVWTLIQRRLFTVLVYNAFPDLGDPSKTSHTIPAQTLHYLLGFKSKNIDHLKNALKSLIVPIEWNILQPNGRDRWKVEPCLASAELCNGICTYRFSDTIRAHLHDPKSYGVVDLRILREFRSCYALALYENCLVFVSAGRTPSLPVATWRELLGAVEPSYNDFSRFRERVLARAIQEVNNISHLQVEPQYTRDPQTRQVTHLYLSITSKGYEALGREVIEHEGIATVVEASRDPLVRKRLAEEMGFTPAQVDEYIGKYSDEHIAQVLDYVAIKLQTGRVKYEKRGAYFHGTIAKAARETLKTSQQGNLLGGQGGAQSRLEKTDKPDKTRNDSIVAQVDPLWSALPEERREALLARFLEDPQRRECAAVFGARDPRALVNCEKPGFKVLLFGFLRGEGLI